MKLIAALTLFGILFGAAIVGIAYAFAPVQNYGNEGFATAGDAMVMPASVGFNLPTNPVYIWTPSTTDDRALQYAFTSDRIAACWYGDQITVELTTSETKKVSFYMVDWDAIGRRQRIDVMDAPTGALLDSRQVTDFSGGVYLTWTVVGHVRFVISKEYENAVLSGIFVDPVSMPSPSPTATPTPTVTPTPVPSPSPSPTATPTPVPSPSPTPRCPFGTLPNGNCRKH